MRVLAMFEGDPMVWVVQALEEDVASQARVGGSLLEALYSLGVMFDARDVIAATEATAPLSAAPDEYLRAWDAGMPIGTLVLGECRAAQVRFGQSPMRSRLT
jgi:hypothetical protein